VNEPGYLLYITAAGAFWIPLADARKLERKAKVIARFACLDDAQKALIERPLKDMFKEPQDAD
jgi:hypothetical protein